MNSPTSPAATKGRGGLVYVFTGDGKGKTSAALGVVTRSLLIDKNVAWISFYKQESWGLAESKLGRHFDNLEMFFGGKGFKMKNRIEKVGDKGHVVVDTASEQEHKSAAERCLVQIESMLAKKPFLIVMDEVLNAVGDGLVMEHDVLELIEKRGETHLIMTGRGLSKELEKVADLVTECKKVKHPYDVGKLAVAGLDF